MTKIRDDGIGDSHRRGVTRDAPAIATQDKLGSLVGIETRTVTVRVFRSGSQFFLLPAPPAP